MAQLTAFEGTILLWIQNNIRCDILTPVMRVITSLGDHGIFWILLTLALLIPKKTRRLGIASVAALLLSVVFNNLLLKNIIARQRPYEVIEGLMSLVGKQSEKSFPSGHAATAFASSVAIFLTVHSVKEKRFAVALIVLSVLISLSRLYVGVHYPTDVLAGIISGCCCGIAGSKLGQKLCESGGRFS